MLEFEFNSGFDRGSVICKNFTVLSVEPSAIFSHNVPHQMHQNIIYLQHDTNNTDT